MLSVRVQKDIGEYTEKIVGKPQELPWGDKIVGIVTSRDGALLDVIRNIADSDGQ